MWHEHIGPGGHRALPQSVLYDLARDPRQLDPVRDAGVEARLTEAMVALMRACEAPPEAYARLGLVVDDAREVPAAVRELTSAPACTVAKP
jgi:hypothetical protein